MSEEQAASWAASVQRMQKFRRRVVIGRAAFGASAVFYPLLAAFNILIGAHWALSLGIADMLLCWFFYRLYLVRCREAVLWQVAIYDGLRMLTETAEYAEAHSVHLDKVLDELLKLASWRAPFAIFGPSRIKATLRSYYWWTAWKLVKRVRIFLEWWKGQPL